MNAPTAFAHTHLPFLSAANEFRIGNLLGKRVLLRVLLAHDTKNRSAGTHTKQEAQCGMIQLSRWC
jgi:hypothetical protein